MYVLSCEFYVPNNIASKFRVGHQSIIKSPPLLLLLNSWQLSGPNIPPPSALSGQGDKIWVLPPLTSVDNWNQASLGPHKELTPGPSPNHDQILKPISFLCLLKPFADLLGAMQLSLEKLIISDKLFQTFLVYVCGIISLDICTRFCVRKSILFLWSDHLKQGVQQIVIIKICLNLCPLPLKCHVNKQTNKKHLSFDA